MYPFLRAQTSSRSLVLDVGEDRLVLTARPSLYHLDIFHPLLIHQESSFAQYNSSTQVRNTNMDVLLQPTQRLSIICCMFTCFSGPYGHHACGLFMNQEQVTPSLYKNVSKKVLIKYFFLTNPCCVCSCFYK